MEHTVIIQAAAGWMERAMSLGGPVCQKDLRVAGRLKRSYVLRLMYIGGMTLMIGFVWVTMGSGATGAAAVAGMSEAAQAVAMAIIWFQFLGLQLLAIAMMSNSICEEVRKRTLEELMSTPVSLFGVVGGKLSSRFIQLAVFLAASFPVLAMLRAFGGIPWDVVISGLAVTLGAVLVATAVSLWCSVRVKDGYRAITGSVALLMTLYLFLPIIANAIRSYYPNTASVTSPLLAINPFTRLAAITASLVQSYTAGSPVSSFQYLGYATAIAVVAVLWAIWYMHRRYRSERRGRVTLRQRLKLRLVAKEAQRVIGNPIVWKDTIKQRGRIAYAVAAGLLIFAGCVFVMIYYQFMHLPGIIAGMLVFWINIKISYLAAGSIAGEKEGRSWTALLSTPLDDWELIKSKSLAVLRRTAFEWLLLCAIIVLGTVAMFEEYWPSLMLMPLYVVPYAFFALGWGMLCSTFCKTARNAVVACIGGQFVMMFVGSCFNSLVFMLLVAGSDERLAKLVGGLVMMVVYGLIGWLFLVMATRRVRKNIF